MIREKRIEKELIGGSTLKEVAEKWQLSRRRVASIKERAILRHLAMKHPEDVANDFQVPVQSVLLIQYKAQSINEPFDVDMAVKVNEPFDIDMAVKIKLAQLISQKIGALSGLKKGKTINNVAEELGMNQRDVEAIRNLQIEKEYRSGKTTEDIHQKFHISEDRVRNIRNKRILRQKKEGKSVGLLAENYKLSKAHVWNILRPNMSIHLQPGNVIKKRVITSPPVSEKIKKEVLDQLMLGIPVKDTAARFQLKVPTVFEIRNEAIYTWRSNKETTEVIAEKLKMKKVAVQQTIFRNDVAKYTGIKRKIHDCLTEEQAIRVRSLIHKFQTNKQISESLGVKVTLVRSMRERMYRRRRSKLKYNRITKEIKEKIASERGKLSVVGLSVKYGVSQNTVRAILNRDQETKKRKKMAKQKKVQEKKLKRMKEIEKAAKKKAERKYIQQIISTPSSRARPIKGKQRS
ncbi:hypothetical protein A5844_000455 [Enterococcus sp. 10A9_DIV0425]|uniref:Uncharacterized protein n=2 Tax=Candidatus Enterococcus wittei TaxID=1987383 RepID=A0A2C9XPU8_9ENTE|nr:hypothetical protein A5844_000455 [Enterococcus sp. 10A9_DIV0425]